MDVNYITEINCFEQWTEVHYLPIASQLLWYKMMSLCNRCGWAEWITVDNRRLMAVMQMSREATFIEVRNKLVEAGLMEYRKGKKGSPNQYKMNYFTFKCEVQTVVNTVVNTVVESEVNTVVNTVDINKLNKTKPNNNKNIVPDGCAKQFVPPALEEVKAYCAERCNSVDPQAFIDFYESKGWMVGKTKMENWQASVRTWEKRSKQEPLANKFNNMTSRNNDYAELERNLLGG